MTEEQLWDWGSTISDSILGGTKHFFLPILYNLRNIGGGGGSAPLLRGPCGIRQRFIFYTQKNHNFRICLPKKSLFFLAYPKESLSPFLATQNKSLCFFCDPKFPTSFIDPKKSVLAKMSDPKKITRTPSSLKYVSGALGLLASSA